jgi:hypothetical protein
MVRQYVKPPRVDYFILAKQAEEARDASSRTGNVKDLRKAIKLYKRAADEAFKQGDDSTARILSSKAHNLQDVLHHVFEDFDPL